MFQVAAVNEYYDRTNKASNPPGQVKYEQELSTGPTDTGERLYDYASGSRQPAKDSAGREMKPPSIPTAELETISNNLSGKNEKGFVMVNGAYADQNATKFNSEKDMAQTLEQMKKDGKLPAILWVDAQHEPFFSDSGAGLAGGSGGAHVVSITDYDPKTGAASVDNQWQQSADHKVPLHDLFIASRSSLDPAALTMVGTDVAVNKALGQIDGAKELDYLRLQKNASKLNADEYDSKIIETMKANTERWRSNGETFSGEQAKATEKFEQLLRGMSSTRANAIRKAMRLP